jgi:NarL family two-component system response regulator LiaR
MMQPIRVLVVDDHRLFRQGLISLMNTREDLVEVVGEASDGRQAIDLALDLHPDVILMDIYMPGIDGLQATREICSRLRDVSVTMLTSSEMDEHIYQAVRLGATGYMRKTLDARELFELLECLARGEVAVPRSVGTRLFDLISEGDRWSNAGHNPLTERELDVLYLVASGATNPEIADELCIAVNTVKAHLHNILRKLQVDNRTEAATLAVKEGLVPTALR